MNQATGKRSHPRGTNRSWKIRFVHAVRITIVITLLALLPSPHRRDAGGIADVSEPLSAPELEWVLEVLGSATSIAAESDSRGRFKILAGPQTIGYAVRTLPEARDIVGYRGPTEALLVMDTRDRILGVRVLHSHDTDEHVAAIERSTEFLDQFKGLTWNPRAPDRAQRQDVRALDVDGVSGATLTSLAMAEGIFVRLGKQPDHRWNSLVFPKPITLDEARRFFPNAMICKNDPVAIAKDDSEALLGYVVRTGPFADDEIGYQGPSEWLLGFTPEHQSLKPRLRSSLDNDPYVGYVPTEYSFWPPLIDQPLESLATLDLEVAGIEGVSGATMTSMAAARSIVRTAAEIRDRGGLAAAANPKDDLADAKPREFFANIKQAASKIRFSSADGLTLGCLALLWLLTSRRWMRNRIVRGLWLLSVVLAIGLYTGNLVSLALVAGWATSGVVWYLAIGLIGITSVAMVLPPTTRGNPYCNHLCPHGALQQWIRPTSKSKRRILLPAKLGKVLSVIPALTLAAAYLALLWKPSLDVSSIEPFHAYLWPMASLVSVIFAIGTLAISAVIPMAYCRLGCPTGRLIEHIRLAGNRDRWTWFDGGTLVVLLVALGKAML
ncbi:MAG: FMN-binding protein [Planctomycetota bacterium]